MGLEVISGCMYCHRKGQLILLSDGSLKPVEEIAVGEHVISPQGHPAKVLALHRGAGKMAEIKPRRKYKPFVVSLDHQLTLIDTPRKSNGKPCERGGRILDVSVREWLDWSPSKKNIFKLYRVGVDQFVSPGLEGSDLDPYFLGVLLGDGSFTKAISVTTADPEIVQEVEKQASLFKLHVSLDQKPGNASTTYHLSGTMGKANPIADLLRSYGLHGLSCGAKFIPGKYQTASREHRLQLLAGLLDTDGHNNNHLGFDFISKSISLAENVAFIARSLGLAATINEARKRAQTGPVRTYYRVYIGGDVSMIPTRLPRKQNRRTVKHRPTLSAFEVSLLPEAENYFGITVEGGRYLLGDFTVTHNSGKSEELLHRIRRVQLAKKAYLLVKPAIDTRYSKTEVYSHSGYHMEAHNIDLEPEADENGEQDLFSLWEKSGRPPVVGVDEAQFFTGLPSVVDKLMAQNVRVIVAGLDLDYLGRPFGPMPELLAMAEQVTKLEAVCTVCGHAAHRTLRVSGGASLIEIGGAHQYEARCREHWTPR